MKKLMVRETSKYVRSMTTEESCMFHFLQHMLELGYKDCFYNLIKDCLYNKHGFMYITNMPYGATSELGFAVFKKTTEHEATNNEKMAYHYMKIHNMCNSIKCDSCMFDGICPVCDGILTSKCVELIKEKEFYEVDNS